MTSGSEGSWYALGFFTYFPAGTERFLAFERYAEVIARALVRCCEGRLHWGKYFPLKYDDIKTQYPFKQFHDACAAVDPKGIFLNEYAEQILGFARPGVSPTGGGEP